MAIPFRELPRSVTWTVAGLCILPTLLNVVGVDFGVPAFELPLDSTTQLTPEQLAWAISVVSRGEIVHTLLEWSAVCVAFFATLFAFTHYTLRQDVTTPIVGSALFFSGVLDAFHTLAAAGLLGPVDDPEQFIPFTWALSRTFNAVIMIAGTAIFLDRGPAGYSRNRRRGSKFLILVGVLFGLVAYAIIQALMVVPSLPQSIYPEDLIPRPWDIPPLVLFLIAGGVVFPRFYRRHPSAFSYALFLSVLPHMVTQAHAAFGSTELYDNHFVIAHFLKIVAYFVPLVGLVLDYKRVYRLESRLRTTEAKLQVARTVQQGLLPRVPPRMPGYDLAGISYAADAVGGDFFDYLSMREGGVGIVIADVSGHDLSASLLMAETRSYIRALAESFEDVAEIATRTNRFLMRDVQNTRFISSFLARIQPELGTLVYAAAGHEGHLVRADGRHEHLQNTGPLLGVIDTAQIEPGETITLNPGDIFVVFTDGVPEAENADQTPFGLERALAIVRERSADSAREIVEAMYSAVQEFTQRDVQIDDVTIVVLKRLPAGKPAADK